MPYNHGVYNQEQETSLTTPIQGTAGLQVIFGTAPIHLAEDPAAAVNKPVVCYSFAECQQAMGYSDDFENFTLCQSMDACFRVFNVAPIILVNVLDPGKSGHTTQNTEEECAVADGAVAYAKQFVLLDTIVVKNADATLVAGSDYVATHAEDGTVTITILSEAAKEAETLKVASTSLKPDGVTAADIVGGVDALTGKETGLELVRQIYPRFGMTPGILLAPGWSHNPTVAAALQAKTEGINGNFDCVTYLDISTDPEEDGAEVYTDVKTAKEALGATSPHAAALWPMGAVGDKVYYLSAMFAALTAYTDAGNSDVPSESPSNKDWGNNTAAYPSTTDPKDRWLAVRRFFDWDGNNFILTYFQKVDKPGNTRLIQSIVDSQNIIGNGYVARDYCAGYRTEFKSDENPITNLLDGHLTVHTYLAPYIPAEYIENIREYDTEALEAALTGGGE